MQHYFANIEKNKVLLTSQDSHHLLHVMRMKLGDEIIAIDDGKEYLAKITSLSPLIIEVEKETKVNNELKSEVTLLFCLAKGDKIDFVIQKATELGASRIVLVKSRYCVVKLSDDDFKRKLPRYISIAKEASEQSHRQIIPSIEGVYDINKLPDSVKSKVNYVCYEKCDDNSGIDVDYPSISVLVGSEGGLADDEIESLSKQGFKSISLGKRILRTETAAISVLSVIGYKLDL